MLGGCVDEEMSPDSTVDVAEGKLRRFGIAGSRFYLDTRHLVVCVTDEGSPPFTVRLVPDAPKAVCQNAVEAVFRMATRNVRSEHVSRAAFMAKLGAVIDGLCRGDDVSHSWRGYLKYNCESGGVVRSIPINLGEQDGPAAPVTEAAPKDGAGRRSMSNENEGAMSEFLGRVKRATTEGAVETAADKARRLSVDLACEGMLKVGVIEPELAEHPAFRKFLEIMVPGSVMFAAVMFPSVPGAEAAADGAEIAFRGAARDTVDMITPELAQMFKVFSALAAAQVAERAGFDQAALADDGGESLADVIGLPEAREKMAVESA